MTDILFVLEPLGRWNNSSMFRGTEVENPTTTSKDIAKNVICETLFFYVFYILVNFDRKNL